MSLPRDDMTADPATFEGLIRRLGELSSEYRNAQAVCRYLDDPKVLLQIPQPHRMKLSELLHKEV